MGGHRRRGARFITNRWPSGGGGEREPFRCYFDTDALHERVRALGFTEIEDLDRAALVGRYLPYAAVAPRPGPGGHVVRLAAGPK